MRRSIRNAFVYDADVAIVELDESYQPRHADANWIIAEIESAIGTLCGLLAITAENMAEIATAIVKKHKKPVCVPETKRPIASIQKIGKYKLTIPMFNAEFIPARSRALEPICTFDYTFSGGYRDVA
jgi:hypothetical protein